MQMGMKVEVLSPTVQHRKESQRDTQTFGITGNGERRLGGSAEEDLIESLLVVEGERGNGFGDGEDHMEVLHRQQFGAALVEPFFARPFLALGAVAIPAGAVLNVGVLAVVAPFDHTAQRGGTAGFDGLHQTELMQGSAWASR